MASPGTLPSMSKFVPQGREVSATLYDSLLPEDAFEPYTVSMAISVC